MTLIVTLSDALATQMRWLRDLDVPRYVRGQISVQLFRRLRILQRVLARMSPNTRGILAMLGAMAGFSFGDALMKLSAAHFPTGEAIFVRGVMATAGIWYAVRRSGAIADLPKVFDKVLAMRTACDVAASFFFITALGKLPLAEASAIMQTNPLAITAGAALFLGEQVGWRRWTATAVGFFGALLIIQPGALGFSWASMLVVGAVLAATARDLVTGKMPAIPTVLVIAAAATTTTIMGFALGRFEVWHWPSLSEIAVLACAAVCLLIGQSLMVISVRSGDVSAVMPFRYSAMLWSLLLSAAIWHYYPNRTTLLGIVIIVGAGLYTFFREQALRRERQPQ